MVQEVLAGCVVWEVTQGMAQGAWVGGHGMCCGMGCGHRRGSTHWLRPHGMVLECGSGHAAGCGAQAWVMVQGVAKAWRHGEHLPAVV